MTNIATVYEVIFQSTGFTALGKVWEQGESVVIADPSDAWTSTLDEHGKSWTQLDESEQESRYKRLMFSVREVDGSRRSEALSSPSDYHEKARLANLHDVWAAEDRAAKEPLRWQSRTVLTDDPQEVATS